VLTKLSDKLLLFFGIYYIRIWYWRIQRGRSAIDCSFSLFAKQNIPSCDTLHCTRHHNNHLCEKTIVSTFLFIDRRKKLLLKDFFFLSVPSDKRKTCSKKKQSITIYTSKKGIKKNIQKIIKEDDRMPKLYPNNFLNFNAKKIVGIRFWRSVFVFYEKKIDENQKFFV